MPRDAEIDKIIRPGGKTIFGYGDEALPAKPAPAGGEAAAATDAPPGLHMGGTPYSDMSIKGKLGQGVVHGMADIATGAGRLASKVLPQGVSDFVSEHGGQRVADFADRPYEGPLEMAGSALGQIGSLGMGGGEMRLGQLAATKLPQLAQKFPAVGRLLPSQIQYLRSPWGGWFTVNPAFTRAQGVVRKAGNIAEATGRGAAAGAVADPENPGQGAMAGAAGAQLGPAVKGAFHSPLGRFLGEHVTPSAAYAGMHAATGIPFHLGGQAITWHSSPIGRRLRQFGRSIVDSAGHVVGTVMTPQTGGYIAGDPRVSQPAGEVLGAGVDVGKTLLEKR